MNWIDNLQKIREAKKKILVVGMGISGVETAKFLLEIGIVPVCTEKQDAETFRAKSKFVTEADKLKASGAEIHFGIDGEKVTPLLKDVGLAVLSPGVGLETAIVGAIQRNNIQIISELELGVQIHQGKTIVVTGSIGKSTTTSLIAYLLEAAGAESILCGNVGTPVIASPHLLETFNGKVNHEPVLAVEASSYQLETCTVIRPTVSVLLNLVENHLERHGTMERYGLAKARVFRNQESSEMLICNYDDKRVFELGKSAKAQLALFGAAPLSELTKYSAWAASVKADANGAGIIELSIEGNIESYNTEGALLLGRHNRMNMAPALLACRRLGISKEKLEEALLKFPPLEHRIERLPLSDGLVVINDSKATTVAAAEAALLSVLESFGNRKIKLLLGGLSKAGSWDPLFKLVAKQNSRMGEVICFGKDGQLISSLANSHQVKTTVAPKLKDAVEISCKNLSKDEVVLLSPGCASFDEFTDFENRGREFKRMVKDFVR